MLQSKGKRKQTKNTGKNNIKKQKGGQASGQASDYNFDTEITEIDVLEIPDDITSNTK